jgi:two-component system alkaline phosphatase synthesis response regulator PhoP
MQETKPIIMVVDDQPDFIEGVKLILEVEGYEVWTASNGREALDRLQSVAEDKLKGFIGALPDLILADIMMPVMDGYVLYEHTQEHPALGNIPFVFLTAKTGAGDLQYGKKLGVEDYLAKPCSPDVLLASVRGQLRGGKLPQQQIQYYEDRFPPAQKPQSGQEKASEQTISNANIILFILAVIGIVVTLVAFGSTWLPSD